MSLGDRARPTCEKEAPAGGAPSSGALPGMAVLVAFAVPRTASTGPHFITEAPKDRDSRKAKERDRALQLHEVSPQTRWLRCELHEQTPSLRKRNSGRTWGIDALDKKERNRFVQIADTFVLGGVSCSSRSRRHDGERYGKDGGVRLGDTRMDAEDMSSTS